MTNIVNQEWGKSVVEIKTWLELFGSGTNENVES